MNEKVVELLPVAPVEEYAVQSFAILGAALELSGGQTIYRFFILDHMLIVIAGRFFKAYRAQPRLAIVTETLKLASSDLAHFMIVLLTVFVSYALAGMFLFGRRYSEFSTFVRAVCCCFNIL